MAKALHEIVAIKEGVEAELMRRPGVTAVDVGYKYVNGQRTDQLAIRVMVERKKKTVPEAERIAPQLDGVVTDVIERTYFLHQMQNRRKLDDISLLADTGNYDPVKGGISIGPCRAVGGYVYVGTLGAIVKDNASGNPLLLSNFHVMCIDNGWHQGDTMAQPGRVDGGNCPANVVGTLQRAALTSDVDCAVSSLSGRGYSCEIVDIGKVAGTNTATLGMAVRKRGRTTGLTYGVVDSISLSVNIDYGDGIGVRTLANQIDIRPDTAHNPAFGDHGDSGSAVVDGSIKVVGLHFAGSNDGHGIANPIAAVLSALNISMCVGTKSLAKDLKDHKEAAKDHKDAGKEHKDLIKDHKELGKDHKDLKDLLKDHKEAVKDVKEIKEHKPEKLEVEVPGKTLPDVPPGKGLVEGGPIQPPAGPIQSAAQAGLEKATAKEAVKELKEKDQIKEWKEKNEAKDHKDQKEHKIEIKELKIELKEHKLEVKELEKTPFDYLPGKGLVESGPFPAPAQPGSLDPAGIERRLAQLEAAFGQLATFITSELRPDLSAGALSNEPGQGKGPGCGC